MPKERKSPQDKKRDHYTKDHFTSGWGSTRSFEKTWNKKKARLNRAFRRKSDQLLASAEHEIRAGDTGPTAEELTIARLQKSINRKRLHKVGTVNVGDRVKSKLQQRENAVGRNARQNEKRDSNARLAIEALNSLTGKRLRDAANLAHLLCTVRDRKALNSIVMSQDPVDRALYFLYLSRSVYTAEFHTLRRNPELSKRFELWLENATQIVEREKLVSARKRPGPNDRP